MKHIAEPVSDTAVLPSTVEDVDIAVPVIVPVSERPESLTALYYEYAACIRALGRPFEFVFVADPWLQRLTAPLADLAARGEPVRVLEVGQTVGESSLLRLAAANCRGAVVVTLPAYRRVEAEALPELIARIDQGADLVVARRWPRRDSWINRFQTRAFHALVGRVAGGGRLHDIACGVRAMRRQVLENIPLYGDFFRFLPLLALREGYRVEELRVRQHAADLRTRVYRPGVYLRRLIDILGLYFLFRFTEKPLRFFGFLGSLLSMTGLLTLGVLFAQRLGGQGIANRPLLLLGSLLLVLGVQSIALGLIGEIIVHLHASRARIYRLANPVSSRSP